MLHFEAGELHLGLTNRSKHANGSVDRLLDEPYASSSSFLQNFITFENAFLRILRHLPPHKIAFPNKEKT